MKPVLFAAALAGLAACASAEAPAQPAADPGTLVFSAADQGSLSRVTVTLTVPGDADGETVFDFPDNWGPDEDLQALVSGRRAVDAATGEDLAMSADGAQLRVSHAPARRIRLSWTLRQDYDGLPQWGVQRMPGMRPVLQPGYASLIGHTILPSVEGRDPQVTVAFDGIPGGAEFSQPSAGGVSGPIPLSTAQDSIYALGAFATTEATNSGVRVSMLGDFALDDTDVASITASVIAVASNVFADAPFKHYFVAMTPLPDLPDGSSVIGTGFTESFFILATPNAREAELTHTIVHEILHEWITRRMGTTDDATDPARMWFTEGFTEYYTQLILLDRNEVSLDGFLGNLNEMWAAYQTSPVNTMPASELIDHIWDSRQTERLPYQRGLLLAFSWDTAGRERGRTLADAIAALLNRADALREAGETPQLTDTDIEYTVGEAIGPRFEADLATHVRKGQILKANDLVLPDCLHTEMPEGGAARLVLAPNADPTACRATILKALMPPL